MNDSGNLELIELREEIKQLYGRLADVERQLSSVLAWRNHRPDLPNNRHYPAQLEKHG